MALTLPTGFQAQLEAAALKPVTVYEIGPAPYTAAETLTNGDLESWSSASDCDDWSEIPNLGAVAREASEIHGGTYSAKLTENAEFINVTPTLTPGKWYHASFWYKSDQTASTQNAFRLYNSTKGEYLKTDATFQVGVATHLLNFTTSWQRYSIWFQVPATHAAGDAWAFYLRGHAAAATPLYYYDDCSLTGPFDRPALFYSSQAVTWNGDSYTAMVVRASPVKETMTSKVPEQTVVFSNVSNALRSLITPTDLITGKRLTSRLLLRDSSDALLEGSLVQHLGIIEDLHVIDQNIVQIRSVGLIHNHDSPVPAQRVKRSCGWKFADGVNCNYTSTTTTTNSGASSTGPINVADAALLVQDKKITVGSSAEVTISTVDTTNDKIWVDTAISWSASDSVVYTECNREDSDCTYRVRQHEYGGFSGTRDDEFFDFGSPLRDAEIVLRRILRELGVVLPRPVRSLSRADPDALARRNIPVPLIYGQRLTPGVAIEKHSGLWVAAARLKINVMLVSAGEIDSVVDWYANDEVQADRLTSSGGNNYKTTGIYYRTGEIGLDADEALADYQSDPTTRKRDQNRDLLTQVFATHTYSRFAYVTMLTQALTDQESLSNVRFEVKGIKCQKYTAAATPTTDGSPVFTRNPIWQVVDLLLNADYGLGRYIQDTDLDFSVIKPTADACDTEIEYDSRLVTLANASSKEYKIADTYGFYRGCKVTGIAVAVFGTGTLDDLVAGGSYTDANGDGDATFTVEIEAGGGDPTSPNTFRWRKDAGAWNNGNACTTIDAPTTLQEGVTVYFGATTGHADGDDWTIGVMSDVVDQVTSSTTLEVVNTARNSAIGDIISARGAQYTSDIVLDSILPAPTAVETILSACDGYITHNAIGQIEIRLEGTLASSATFADTSPAQGYGIVEDSFELVVRDRDFDSEINRVYVGYDDQDLFGDEAQVTDWTHLDGDTPGTGRPLKELAINIPGVISYEHAFRMAQLALDKRRTLKLGARFRVGPIGLSLQPGDVISVTHSVPGWTANDLRVKSLQRIGLGDSEECCVEIEAIDYNSTIYSVPAVTARPDPPSAPTGSPVITPTVDGDFFGRVHLTWTWTGTRHPHRYWVIAKATSSWGSDTPAGDQIIAVLEGYRASYTYQAEDAEIGTTVYFRVGTRPLRTRSGSRRIVWSSEISAVPVQFDPTTTEGSSPFQMIFDNDLRQPGFWSFTGLGTPTVVSASVEAAGPAYSSSYTATGGYADPTFAYVDDTTVAVGEAEWDEGTTTIVKSESHYWSFGSSGTKTGRLAMRLYVTETAGPAVSTYGGILYSVDSGATYIGEEIAPATSLDSAVGNPVTRYSPVFQVANLNTVRVMCHAIPTTGFGEDVTGTVSVEYVSFEENAAAGPTYGGINNGVGYVQGDGSAYGTVERPFPGKAPPQGVVVFQSGQTAVLRIAARRSVSGSAPSHNLEFLLVDKSTNTYYTTMLITPGDIVDDWRHYAILVNPNVNLGGVLYVVVRTKSTNGIDFGKLGCTRGSQIWEWETSVDDHLGGFHGTPSAIPPATAFPTGPWSVTWDTGSGYKISET